MPLDPSTLNVIFGTVLSCIGLYLGFKRFNLKSGISIRGSYGTSSSIACEDEYIHKINLENKKDKAVTIFAIYLRIYPNYYLTIQDFEDSPLILKGFETYQNAYDPIEFYSINCNKVKIGDLLNHKKAKGRLVLATSEGKYVIRKRIKYWDPIGAFFDNHWTALIQPVRATHNGKGYGGNAKYIVEFKSETGQAESVPIYPKDYEIKKFKKFSLTKESLESKAHLASYLETLRSDGVISASELTVHDLEQLREERFEFYADRRELDLPRIGWFKYYIIGRIATLISDWKLKQKNKALKNNLENKTAHTSPLPVSSQNLNDDSNP
jgi:hypothetical protein